MMELPIKSPSKISYADVIVFKDLLNDLSREDFTGFLRFTHNDSDEGYILFENGEPIAASYVDYLAVAASASDQPELVVFFRILYMLRQHSSFDDLAFSVFRLRGTT